MNAEHNLLPFLVDRKRWSKRKLSNLSKLLKSDVKCNHLPCQTVKFCNPQSGNYTFEGWWFYCRSILDTIRQRYSVCYKDQSLSMWNKKPIIHLNWNALSYEYIKQFRSIVKYDYVFKISQKYFQKLHLVFRTIA